MLRKNLILTGIVISLTFLFLAMLYYPGGSRNDPSSVGYDWKNNYLSNLFTPEAINGSVNSARPWAICSVFFLSISFAWFFVRFSKKIAIKSAANVIKYFGLGATVCVFLAVTPLHDLMIIFASTLSLVAIFYISVFILKSKLHYLKLLSIICLLLFYICVYSYFSRSFLEYLPVLQKASFFVNIIWMLCVEYFTTKADFPFNK